MAIKETRSALNCSTFLVALCLTGIALPATASAQTARNDEAATAPKEDATSNTDIIVTANKRDERLIDVASSVSALKGDDLVRRNLLQVEEFATQVPGLSIQPAGNRGNRIILRGLNSGGTGATVATVIDESALTFSSSVSQGAIDIANLDTYDLQRIEVLRGPQGTLYGAAAEGGLIKYVTNAPKLGTVEGSVQGEIEGVAQGGIGLTARGTINLPIVHDTLALRVTGFYKDIAGYNDNPLLNRTDVNNGRRYGGRAQLLWAPRDDLNFKLTALRQDQHYNDNGLVEFVGAALAPTTPPSRQFNIANGGRLIYNSENPNFSDNSSELFSLVTNFSPSFADIVSATSYGRIAAFSATDGTNGAAAPGVTTAQAFRSFYAEDINLVNNVTNNLKKFNQELRISSKPDFTLAGLNIGWQGGVFYTHEELSFATLFDVLSDRTKLPINDLFLGLPAGGSSLTSDYNEFSAFGSVKLNFTKRLSVEVGGRYTNNWQESFILNRAGLANFIPTDDAQGPINSQESVFTWSVAPSYHFNDDGQVYARVATGYRPGGPNNPVANRPPDFPTEFQSDSTINYEIGTKGYLFDRKVSFDLAAFYIDWTDIQISTAIILAGRSFSIVANAGKASSQGFEWSLSYTPVKGLTIGTVGSYVDAELGTALPNIPASVGQQLSFVPDISNTVNIDYAGKIAGAKVNIGGSWSYVGTRFTSFAAPATAALIGGHIALPTYNTFSLQAGVTLGPVDVTVYTRNLTDARGIATYNTAGSANFVGNGVIIQPRTVGLRVSLKY